MRISDWSSDVCSSNLSVPLFGTADDHAKTLGRRIAADPDLAAGPALIAGKGGRPLMTFPVPLPMGDPLLVSIAFDELTAAAVDRQKRARLNGLATLYVKKDNRQRLG